MRSMPKDAVLLVIDVQKGFDEPVWGRRNNPQAEANIAQLLDAWRRTERPVVFVQHLSREPNSPLRPNQEGCEIKDAVRPLPDEPVIQKQVNSAFIGTDLAERLRRMGSKTIVITGLTTPHCVSTTARMAGNFGFDTFVVADATASYDLTGHDGKLYKAEDLHALSLASLHGEFATILETDALLRRLDKDVELLNEAFETSNLRGETLHEKIEAPEREPVFPASAFHILTS
ncbi:MAG TPA: cysteine hydrolase family protein [Pyrinomonadaceae bacterium]